MVNGSLTGTPFTNDQIPKARFDPVSFKLLEYWPAPTTVLSNNYQVAQPGITDEDQLTLRSDFNERPSSQWFGRYSWTNESVLNKGWAQNGTTLVTTGHQAMLSNTRTSSTKQVNKFRFGLNHFYNHLGL